MASEQLLIQYPIALEIINSWKEQNILYHLDKDEDVFSVLFPSLDIFSDDDLSQLRNNTDFLRQVTLAFPIVMLYYGLYYTDLGFQISNQIRFLILFVRGTWKTNAEQEQHFEEVFEEQDEEQDEEDEEEQDEQDQNEQEQNEEQVWDPPRKEHLRIARILRFLAVLQLTYEYDALKNLAMRIAREHPDEVSLETRKLWEKSNPISD